MFRPPTDLGECPRCYDRALSDAELEALERDGPGYDRQAARERARQASRLVRLADGSVVCPRCTRLPDGRGGRVPLAAVLPNRRSRRSH